MTDFAHKFLLSVAIILLVLPACVPNQPKVNLIGVYKIISGERNGAPIDPKELDGEITIGDHTITAYDKDRKETFMATYTLKTNQKPWQIIMTSTKAPETGVVAKGLIEVDEDRIKLIYALPQGKPPTDFTAGEHQQMLVLAKTSGSQSEGV